MRFALAVLIHNSRMPVYGRSKRFPDPADQRISNLNSYKILWGFLIPLTWSGGQVFLTIILKRFSPFHIPPLLSLQINFLHMLAYRNLQEDK